MKGLTLIEVIIVLTILGILGAVVTDAYMNPEKFKQSQSNITYGYNGVTEVRCINGYNFVVGSSGSAQQMLNEKGGGINCE